jgi:hypothetical protein
MSTLNIPQKLNNRLYTIQKLQTTGHNILLAMAGNSSKIIFANFSKKRGYLDADISNPMQIVKIIDLDYHQDLHYVQISDISLIPLSNYFLASADNTTIAKVDYSQIKSINNEDLFKKTEKDYILDIKYLPHHIDYIFKIAASAHNLYLSSSTTGLLCLSDHTTGNFFYLFSTKNHV